MHGTARLVLQHRRFAVCTLRKPGGRQDPVSGSCSGAVAGSSTPHTLSTRSPPRHPVRVKNRGTFEEQREKSKGERGAPEKPLRPFYLFPFIFPLKNNGVIYDQRRSPAEILSALPLRRAALHEGRQRRRLPVLPGIGGSSATEFFSEIKLREKFDKTSLPDYIINGLKEIK